MADATNLMIGMRKRADLELLQSDRTCTALLHNGHDPHDSVIHFRAHPKHIVCFGIGGASHSSATILSPFTISFIHIGQSIGVVDV